MCVIGNTSDYEEKIKGGIAIRALQSMSEIFSSKYYSFSPRLFSSKVRN